MITPTIKILYIKDPWKIQTFFFTFRWRRQVRPVLAPGPGIVFYMLWVVYLEYISDSEAVADVSGHRTRSGHHIVNDNIQVSF